MIFNIFLFENLVYEYCTYIISIGHFFLYDSSHVPIPISLVTSSSSIITFMYIFLLLLGKQTVWKQKNHRRAF